MFIFIVALNLLCTAWKALSSFWTCRNKNEDYHIQHVLLCLHDVLLCSNCKIKRASYYCLYNSPVHIFERIVFHMFNLFETLDETLWAAFSERILTISFVCAATFSALMRFRGQRVTFLYYKMKKNRTTRAVKLIFLFINLFYPLRPRHYKWEWREKKTV